MHRYLQQWLKGYVLARLQPPISMHVLGGLGGWRDSADLCPVPFWHVAANFDTVGGTREGGGDGADGGHLHLQNYSWW